MESFFHALALMFSFYMKMLPDRPFRSLELENPSIDVSEPHKVIDQAAQKL